MFTNQGQTGNAQSVMKLSCLFPHKIENYTKGNTFCYIRNAVCVNLLYVKEKHKHKKMKHCLKYLDILDILKSLMVGGQRNHNFFPEIMK